MYRSDGDESVKELKEHWNEENYHSFWYINKLQLIQDRVTKFKNAWAIVGWIGSYLIPRRIFCSLRGHITKFYYEDALKNPKSYTSANKHQNLYLISTKTENCSTNFVSSLLEHNQTLRTLR